MGPKKLVRIYWPVLAVAIMQAGIWLAFRSWKEPQWKVLCLASTHVSILIWLALSCGWEAKRRESREQVKREILRHLRATEDRQGVKIEAHKDDGVMERELITEEWLKSVGFKWQQFDRQPTARGRERPDQGEANGLGSGSGNQKRAGQLSQSTQDHLFR